MSKRMHLSKLCTNLCLNQAVHCDHLYTSKLNNTSTDRDKQAGPNLSVQSMYQAKRKSTEKINKNLKNKRQKFVTSLTLLPIELLEKIFQHVLKDGDFMYLHLSLVCKHFHNIVQQESFRRACPFCLAEKCL